MNVSRLVRRMLVPALAVGTLLAGMTGTAAADRQTDPSTCAVTYVGFLSFKALWKSIEANPEAFNLRVHNFEHADNGAIRGQLTLA